MATLVRSREVGAATWCGAAVTVAAMIALTLSAATLVMSCGRTVVDMIPLATVGLGIADITHVNVNKGLYFEDTFGMNMALLRHE
jgi:hypothetical protein